MLRRVLAAAGAAAALLVALPAAGRPFTVDDLLHQQAFHASAVDPEGRWLAFERSEPYDTAERYDYDQQAGLALSRLFKVDLAHPGPAARLVRAGDDRGVSLGPFSPSGARLAVFRLRGLSWTLGIVEVASGRVLWLAVTPERSPFGRTVQWIGEDTLLVLARPDGSPPFPLRQGRASADTLPRLWAAAASGAGAHAFAGSGAYAALRPQPPPDRLLKIDARTGARTVLASGPFVDLEASPDRQRVALLARGEDLQPRPDRPSQGDMGIQTQASHLEVLDLASRRLTPVCPDCDVVPSLLTWSPDSREVLVFTRAAGASWRTGVFRRVDARMGTAAAISVGLTAKVEFRPERVHAGWMGSDPVVLARPASAQDAPGRPQQRYDWYRLSSHGAQNLSARLPEPGQLLALDTSGLLVGAAGGLWRLDGSGRPTALTGRNPVRLDAPLPPEPRPAQAAPRASFVSIDDGAGRVVARATVAGLEPIALAPAAGKVVAISAPLRALVVSDRSDAGVESWTALEAGHAAAPLATANPWLAAIDPVEAIPIRHPGPEGQPLTSWLLLPPLRAAAGPAPIVTLVYPGSNYPRPSLGEPRLEAFVMDPRPLLGAGFAVLEASLPKPAGSLEPMAGLADRIGLVVHAVAARADLAGRVDASRVALWGHSFGGYAVMGAITQTDRYCAAVAIAGISDLTLAWSDLPVERRLAPEDGSWSNWSTGNTESGQIGMRAPPWADPARYARNSPLLHAGDIHTPLLLAHGDQDIIPLAQSEAMFSALYRQDKDAMLLTYWGEGHFLSSPGNVRDFYARAFAFLWSRLGDDGAGPESRACQKRAQLSAVAAQKISVAPARQIRLAGSSAASTAALSSTPFPQSTPSSR
jgi:dipeptidyl aminopeptidase/acylaminoacyl peptidase